jgi:diketogulonate reductase-like aldo/keto reductase
VGAVGVCNYDVDQLRKFHSLMAARSIPVVSNQVCALPYPVTHLFPFCKRLEAVKVVDGKCRG